jgi:hypothetical protein
MEAWWCVVTAFWCREKQVAKARAEVREEEEIQCAKEQLVKC